MTTTQSRQRDWQLEDNPTKTCGYPSCNKTHKTKQELCPDCRQGVPSNEIKDSSTHVVYYNVDLEGDIVYVGEGTVGRAHLYWGSSASRDPIHSRWVFEELKRRPMRDVIRIKHDNLTKREAVEIEARYRKELKELGYSLKFNKE